MDYTSIRLLLVEDSADDAELLLFELGQAGFDPQALRVESAGAMRDALERQGWDIIISDYSMPHFSGEEALHLVQEIGLDIPFIIVSGAVGEERAVEIMRAGASDYVMKGNLQRLIPAINRELRDAAERRARRIAEDKVNSLSRALEQSASLVMITDTEGVIQFVNHAFLMVTGYTLQELEGTHSRIFKSGQTPPEVHVDMWDTIVAGGTWRGRFCNQTKYGDLFWVETTVSPIKNQMGETVQFLAVQEDITQRLEIENALRESEERFRLISSVTSDYTFVSQVADDGTLYHTMLSGAFQAISGYTPEEFMKIGGWQVTIHPDDLELDKRHTDSVLSNQREVTELRIIKKGGEIRWVRVYALPVWDEQVRRVTGIYGGVQDITERKLAQEAVRQREIHLRALLDATTDVAFMVNADGTFLTLNRTLAESMEKSVDDLIGTDVFRSLPEQLAQERLEYFKQAARSRTPVRWQDENANTYWDNSIYPIFSDAGDVQAFAVYGRDITVQKRLESEIQRYTSQLEKMVEERTDELRQAKEQIELILNNTSDAIALAQPNGDIRAKNPAFITLFGDEVTENIERILWALMDETHVTSVGSALINVIFDKEQQRLEAQIDSNHGTIQDIDLAFIPVDLGMSSDIDRPGILVSAHDITQFKELERFKARFVADAVHDLATPISGLSTRLYLLERTPGDLKVHLQALKNQVEHLRDLLGDLRTLSQLDRKQLSLERTFCNLNQLVMRVYDTYEPVAINKKQRLSLNIDDSIPELYLDQRRMERVLVNLVSNAINYTPTGKSIAIETSLEGNRVKFSVQDAGIGIAQQDLSRIFERFYRTDEARRTQASGTGLGLAISKEIVELHQGSVLVTSEEGQGSTFTILLPVK